MKNKLMKILYFGLPSLAVGLVILVAIVVIHGWYTNVDKMGQIDANTKNSGFKYEVNGETLETDEYSISNLAFFDINSIYEGKYFNTMVYEIEIEIENITDDNLTYLLTFEGFRQSYKTGNNVNSISYVGCIMSPEKLGFEEQTSGKAGETYYTYDESTHKYTEYSDSATIGDDDDISDRELFAYNPNYIDDIYVLTSDKTVMTNKKYYQLINNEYRECITAGNKILGDVTYYELVYEQAETYSATDITYYEIHTSSNGSAFYTPVDIAKVTPSNYSNFYVLGSGYQETHDLYFQNETYFIKNGNTYTELTTLTPGDTTVSKNYYECGKRVNSLIVNDSNLGITYTPNNSTITNGVITESTDPFKVEYSQGTLGPKDGNKKSQMVYLYVFGVQEVNSALNSEFIEFIHDFRITISATTESSWTVVDEIEDNNSSDNNG